MHAIFREPWVGHGLKAMAAADQLGEDVMVNEPLPDVERCRDLVLSSAHSGAG